MHLSACVPLPGHVENTQYPSLLSTSGSLLTSCHKCSLSCSCSTNSSTTLSWLPIVCLMRGFKYVAVWILIIRLPKVLLTYNDLYVYVLTYTYAARCTVQCTVAGCFDHHIMHNNVYIVSLVPRLDAYKVACSKYEG